MRAALGGLVHRYQMTGDTAAVCSPTISGGG